MLEIFPSVLGCDFSILKDEIKKAEEAGVNGFHFDVMDFHFVPNLTFGPKFISDFKKHTSLPFDIHLMIDNPDFQIDSYLGLKCRNYFFHIEVEANYTEIFKKVKGLGSNIGLAINPKTPLDLLRPYFNVLDSILIMLVNPGFCGQKVIFDVLPKIKAIKQIQVQNDYKFKIYVDGGVDESFLSTLKDFHIDGIVMGNAFFSKKNYTEFVNKIRMLWEI